MELIIDQSEAKNLVNESHRGNYAEYYRRLDSGEVLCFDERPEKLIGALYNRKNYRGRISITKIAYPKSPTRTAHLIWLKDKV